MGVLLCRPCDNPRSRAAGLCFPLKRLWLRDAGQRALRGVVLTEGNPTECVKFIFDHITLDFCKRPNAFRQDSYDLGLNWTVYGYHFVHHRLESLGFLAQ